MKTLVPITVRANSRLSASALIMVLSAIITTTSLADSLLLPVKSTPYDHQMARIRPVLETGRQGNDVSMAMVNRWIGDLRSMPYGFSQIWKTPAEVESSEIGDCKGKAVVLYQKMQKSGAHNLRLVIGKRAPTSSSTHAWVEWHTAQGNYILDPTINWTAYRSDRFGEGSYVPYYAYAGDRKYRAARSSLVAQN